MKNILLLIGLFIILTAALPQDQINQMESTLSNYGTVEYCDYNGIGNTSFVIVIEGFTNTTENKNNVSVVLDSYLTPEGMTESHFAVNGTTLKAEWND